VLGINKILTMKRYLFQLGRQRRLAQAELAAYLQRKHIQYVPTWAHDVAIIETADDLGDPQKVLNQLGGTIKIIELESPIPITASLSDTIRQLMKATAVTTKYLLSERTRWTYGVSLYAPSIPKSEQRQLITVAKDMGMDLKRYLKSRNIGSRFVAVRGRDAALSSVVVRKNGLLRPENTEIVIYLEEKVAARGKTIAVQDFEAYGARDHGRPAREARIGSLPPKLAQIMINLAKVPEGGKIHDPFVGIGTILQEAWLMGYQATGSDNDKEQVDNTRANMQWLNKMYDLELPDMIAWQAEAGQLDIPEGTIDAFITEGTLGPPVSRPYSRPDAVRVLSSLEKLWRETLVQMKHSLKSSGSVLCIWPIFTLDDGSELSLNLFDELPSLGYRLVTKELDLLRYQRPDQVVKRQILQLAKR